MHASACFLRVGSVIFLALLELTEWWRSLIRRPAAALVEIEERCMPASLPAYTSESPMDHLGGLRRVALSASRSTSAWRLLIECMRGSVSVSAIRPVSMSIHVLSFEEVMALWMWAKVSSVTETIIQGGRPAVPS